MKKVIAGLMLVVSVASVSTALDTPVLIFGGCHNSALADLYWTSGGAGTEGYIIYRSTYSGGLDIARTHPYTNVFIGNPDWVQNPSIVSVTTNTISLSWGSGLTTGTSYYFRVQAYNGSTQSALSNEVVRYVIDRSVVSYIVWDGNPSTCAIYATIPYGTNSCTLTGLTRNRAYSYKVSAKSAFDATGYGTIAGFSPGVILSTTTLGCVLSDPHSVSLSVQANVSSVTVTASVEGYDGYGGDGYYQFAHSVNPVITEDDFTNGVTGSITQLVDNNWQISTVYTEGATNYYAIKIVDYNPDVTMISSTKSCYMMSYAVDHFEVVVATSVVAGTSFPVTITGKNADGVTVPLNMNDSTLIQPVLASDESLTGSDTLRITFPKLFDGTHTIYYFAYTKAEDIKIKITYAGKTALSDTLSVIAGPLVTMDAEASPSSIISGQSSDITSYLWDIYGNRIKSIKVQFKINKGKGKLDKDEGEADVAGKIKIKFFDDDGKPGMNTINVTALNLSQDVQINVAVLVNGKNGGTIIASNDPNTQVVIPPDAISEDVQLSIKTGDELSDEIKVKVNNANDKEKGNMCEDKVRNFTITNEDGSEYGNFSDLVTIEIPYTDDDNDGVCDGTTIKVEDLKVCRLDETDECWTEVADGGCNEIDKDKKVIKAQVKHFSTYSIGAPSIVGLSALQVYPNPVNFSKAVRNTMKFENISQNSTVKIYDVTGQLVRSMTGDTNVEWDGKNESGESVGMGLYIYLLTDGNGNKKTGKIGVQK